MSDSEKKQTLKGLDGVSDCRKEYEEADWEEYQIEKQIAEHQARVQAEELEYLEYQLYLQENNLAPEYLDYLASKAENPCQDFLDCDDGWHDEWGDEQLLRELLVWFILPSAYDGFGPGTVFLCPAAGV